VGLAGPVVLAQRFLSVEVEMGGRSVVVDKLQVACAEEILPVCTATTRSDEFRLKVVRDGRRGGCLVIFFRVLLLLGIEESVTIWRWCFPAHWGWFHIRWLGCLVLGIGLRIQHAP